MDVETVCQFACGFFTFMATFDKMSEDGQKEALSMARCMQKCSDMFGKGEGGKGEGGKGEGGKKNNTLGGGNNNQLPPPPPYSK